MFKLILPGQMTESDVSKCAGYYVHNFSVNYNYSSKEAVISMVTNDTKNRQVIVRFMKACGIRLINVEGQLLEIQDFYESYLK